MVWCGVGVCHDCRDCDLQARRLDQDCEPLTFLSEVGQLTRAGRRESQLLCRAGPRARQPCCRWGRGGAGAGPGPGRMSEVGTSNGAL